MSVSISEIKYKNFGRCVRIENAFVELIVTIDIGPRIIRYAIKGGSNFFFEDRARKIKQDPKAMADYYGKGACWYIYGGHRIWASPEFLPQTYFPDNSRVQYHVSNSHTVLFTPPPQRKNGLQVKLEVSLDEYDCSALIKNTITNISNHDQTFAVWALSVLAPGGIEIVPLNRHDRGFLHNKSFSVWSYSNLSDKRLAFSTDLFMLKQDKRFPSPFKIGTDNQRGWSAYILKDAMFIKQFEYIDQATYPDGGMNFETYTCPSFLEMESLGPLMSVAPGSSLTHTEKWDIIDDVRVPKLGDFSAAEVLINKYIGK